ncbi:MAG: phosphatase PAP2 family protein [Clostridiales bacterium]|nr:phosphatase PAP2 family protein [Clostridiales bacterium]
MVDYRSFRLKKINTPEFEHVKLLLFWPLFGLAFLCLERLFNMNYHPVVCALDAKIPFCEYFLIPYWFWFVFIIGIQIYSFFFDVPTFKNYIKYTIISYTLTLLIYIIYPTCQELRPTEFVRSNIFTAAVAFLYQFDTNTNVCPSLHVIGSMAVYFAARKSRLFGTLPWRIAFLVMTILISVSTVFLKQHSIIDIFAAVILGLLVYPIVYSEKKKDKTKEYSQK